jgi:hypothetical protein
MRTLVRKTACGARAVDVEHVIMVGGYGSVTVLGHEAGPVVMVLAYLTVAVIHGAHVKRRRGAAAESE